MIKIGGPRNLAAFSRRRFLFTRKFGASFALLRRDETYTSNDERRIRDSRK